jgi:hypothetical protein
MEGWKGTSIIYVSPTKALAADIRGRMEEMLAPLGIRAAPAQRRHQGTGQIEPPGRPGDHPGEPGLALSHMPEMLKDVRGDRAGRAAHGPTAPTAATSCEGCSCEGSLRSPPVPFPSSTPHRPHGQ